MNATKTIEVLLGKVFKEMMKISDEFLNMLDSRVTNYELEKQQAKAICKVVYQAIQYVETFGTIMDYLCFDSYKFETIIEQFSQQRSLLKVLMTLLVDYSKIKNLQVTLKKRLRIR